MILKTFFVLLFLCFFKIITCRASLEPDCNFSNNSIAKFANMVTKKVWGARPQNTSKIHSQNLPISTVILQHTGDTKDKIPCGFEYCKKRMRGLQAYFLDKRRFGDTGYHFVICGGRIYEARRWDQEPASLYGHNRGNIHIALMGEYSWLNPPLIMLEAVKEIIDYGIKKGFLTRDVTFYAACDLSNRSSPGRHTYPKLKNFKNGFDGHFKQKKPSACEPTPEIVKKVSTTVIVIGIVCGILVVTAAVYYARRKIMFAKRICYPMKSLPRGVCLIINNVNFEATDKFRASVRNGSDVDVENLTKVFRDTLHFNVIVAKDLTASEMLQLCDRIGSQQVQSKHDAFVLTLLTHGGEDGNVYGIDRNPVKVHEIFERFNDVNCIALKGKPKMFFVTACRGRDYDSGRNYNLPRRLNCNIPKQNIVIKIDNLNVDNSVDGKDSVSAFQDMIVVYSCIKEYASPRNPTSGTWFCDSLVTKLKESHNKTHLEKILKIVAKDLIKKDRETNGKKVSAPRNIFVTPEVENIGFTKYLYFNK